MRMAGLLEVCADSVCSAVNAARGGADRIELCSALPLGGLSPDEDLFCMVRERVDIPVRVLLRPRAGDFLYDEDEFELLCCQAARFAGLGADGIVIGMLNPDGTLDAERMSALMTCGDGCGVTLHRAFDVCRDAHEALARQRSSAWTPSSPQGSRLAAQTAHRCCASWSRRAGKGCAS